MELVKYPVLDTLISLRQKARKYGVNTLLTIGGNTKIIKGDKKGVYLTAIQHLAPSNISGHNVCPKASPGCKVSCLYNSGHAIVYPHINQARINRTRLFFENKGLYKKLLFTEINSLIRKAKKRGVKPAIRLNGTSDIIWECVFPDMFKKFSSVMFYDYTKISTRFKNSKLPKNYFLLFSRSETNEKEIKTVLKLGGNVAVVFNKLPKKYKGYQVINGDKTDIRFKEKKGVIVGLIAKGKARKDNSGFVVKI